MELMAADPGVVDTFVARVTQHALLHPRKEGIITII